jgi:hypothetical protein
MTDIAAIGTPEHWRQRAQEAQRDADRHADPVVKTALLEIAALYEELAGSADKGPLI